MEPTFLVVDLFCGAGGTTTGFAMTNGIAKVIACVNHDAKAIQSHWMNHPDVQHYEEDIRTLPLGPLHELVNRHKAMHPNAKLILWASLECTNFSKAKGGQPRDADSRTLADHLPRYIIELNPDYIMIENVVEFMSWGPLNEDGKPVSRRNGADWLRWRKDINALGYRDEWQEMNAANYGAYTSRNRLFGIFAKPNHPIAWPEPTHAKKVNSGMFGKLQPWKAVKDVLDFTDEGKSIFGRDKQLSEKTLERIYAGLIKFVAGGKDNFLAKIYAVASNSDGTYSTESVAHTITTRDAHALIQTSFLAKYFSGRPEGKVISVDGPAGAITCFGGQTLVQPKFIVASNGGTPSAKVVSVEVPSRVITTSDNKALVQPSFLHAYFGNGDNNHSTEGPAPTLTTKDRCVLVNPVWIDENYGNGKPRSICDPVGTITTVPKHSLIHAVPFVMGTNYDNKPTSIEEPSPTITANRKWSYLVNPSWGGNPTGTEQPCPTVVASQNKAPLYLVVTKEGHLAIEIYEADTEATKRIKEFMALYGIVDIKMRMLKISELLKIQGFPEGYKLAGNQSDQKKFIGNSVEPNQVREWAIALHNKNRPTEEAVAA